jgi:enoyl-[acyl-carrier protein] reductase III
MNLAYVLVLGVSSGFGKAAARALAAAGYHIIGVHLDRQATMPGVIELEAELRGYGVRTVFLNKNAADAGNRAEVISAIQTEFVSNPGATLRMMLHSLAFGTLKPFVDTSGESVLNQKNVEMTLDVMANSLVYYTQDIVTNGLMAPGGRIVGLTSAGSTRVLPMYGAVSAAKAAMEAYCRQLALELAPYQITANSIRAGVTHTPALSKIPGSDLIMNNAFMRNPYHRLTTPEDVANVLTLLVRPEAQWINGEILGVDGGEDAVDLTWWKPAPQQ